jgi:hypothetical protein
MALRLKSREIPLVTFRRVLPAFLGPEGEECFIEVDARAGGAINQAYVAASEALILRLRVLDRKAQKLEDDSEFITTTNRNVMMALRERMGVLHDACVIDWRTNILSDEKPIQATRENFLDLSEVRVPEVAAAIADLEAEVLKVGAELLKADGGVEKN